MELLTQEIGSIRKPSWLLKTLRDPNSSNEIKEQTRDDLAYINIRGFEDAGLDIVYDGEARRAEMYEFPISRIKGFEFCGKIRSWDNKYFRKARCINKIEYTGQYHSQEMKHVQKIVKADYKVPITGPYTLADWSYNEKYDSREEFIFTIAKSVIRPLIKDMIKEGAKNIQIDEPAATTHPSEMKLFTDAINYAVEGLNANFNIHICYSGNNYRELFPECLDLKINQFTLEFANMDTLSLGLNDSSRKGYAPLKYFKEFGDKRQIGLGVIDVHNDEIEDPKLVRDRIIYSNKILKGENEIIVNPDCGLRTRTRETSFAKLRNMVQGTKLATQILNK